MTASTSPPRRRWFSGLLLIGGLAAFSLPFRAELVDWFSGGGRGPALDGQLVPVEGASGIDHYTCSMHPSVHQKAPGRCPICSMDLTPVTSAQQQDGVVLIDEARRSLSGVHVEAVVLAPLARTLRAVGRVTYDETTLTDVTLEVRGRITQLYASQTGQAVTAGAPLFQLYSPELFDAQQDFLLASGRMPAQASAASSAAADSPARRLAESARRRLRLLGLTDGWIDGLAQRGVPSESITFPSPASGHVIEKDVTRGAAVSAGQRLYRIADLTRVWVEAEVYEGDLPHVFVGQPARVTLDHVPGHSQEARVSSIYPSLDEPTRTGRVRIALDNPELRLRPGMYATVELASAPEPRLQVPVSAVVYTGPRRIVFVDLGEGRLRPQEVRVGAASNGMYEVLEGLSPGARVATSGVFLIAAEARITTRVEYWEKAAP